MQGSTANVCMSIKVTRTFPALRRRVSDSENTSLESQREAHTERVVLIYLRPWMTPREGTSHLLQSQEEGDADLNTTDKLPHLPLHTFQLVRLVFCCLSPTAPSVLPAEDTADIVVEVWERTNLVEDLIDDLVEGFQLVKLLLKVSRALYVA